MNGLGARRLSNRTDESTSIERQGEQIQLTAKVRGDKIVYMTEDTDVPGAISPFERKDLGPWLTDPDKISQWDVLYVAKLDRLTRSIIHFHELVNWLDRNGKTLVSVAESLDLSTPAGRMFANLLAMFAQFERARASERRKEASDLAKRNGWYDGGRYKFGYRPVKVDSHWELEPDPEKVEILNLIGSQIAAGKSRSGIAKQLEAEKKPAPFGGEKWARDTVARVLVQSQELLDESIRHKVLDALDTTRHPFTRRGGSAMLLNVGFCGKCQKPLYAKRNLQKGKYLYEDYYCSGRCGAKLIRMNTLDEIVSESITDSYGWVPIMEKTVTRGQSHLSEIAAIEQRIRELDLDDPDYDDMLSELRRQRTELKNATKERDRVHYTATGQTVEDYWPTLDKDARRLFLLGTKVKVYAVREADGEISVGIGPETFEGGEFFSTVHALDQPVLPPPSVH